MADIAELGFQVNTSGLKAGTSELDNLNKSAKEVETQAKRTGDAVTKAGDGAKKLGTDSKTAADGMDGMSKQAKAVADSLDKQIVKMQLTAAEYKVLQNLQKAGTTLDTEAGRAIAARTLALEAQLAGTQRAAVSNGVLGQSLSSLFPQMTATTTATRAMAVAKGEAAVSSANLAAGLNVLRPAVVAAGGAMGTLPAAAAAARFGLVGVGAAAAGGAALGLAKAADEADRSKSRFGALLGSTEAGTRAFQQIRDVSKQTGVEFGTMSGAVERAMGGLNKFADQPGVYRVLTQGGVAAQDFQRKITEAFGVADRVLATGRASAQETKTALDSLGESFGRSGTLTADAFRKVAEASPRLGLEIAKAFNTNSIDQFDRKLQNAPVSSQQFIRAMERIAPVVKQQFDEAGESVDRGVGKIGAAWDNLVDKLGKSGMISGPLNAAASSVDGISTAIQNDIKFFKDWENIIPNVGNLLKSEAEQLPTVGQGFLDLANKIGTAGASVITFFEGQVDGAINGASAALQPAANSIMATFDSIISKAMETGRAIAAALTQSPVGGNVPTLSDTGDVTPGVAPQAMGNALAGGRVIPFALGGVVTAPKFFPMADGMGLMGEAGPEAVMPLARGPDGKLGVTVSGGGGAQVPFDPFTEIAFAIDDQTTELRNAMDAQADAIGADFTRGVTDIVAAINAGNILLKDFAGRTGTAAKDQTASTEAFGGAVDGFGTAVAGFGSAVQVASGGGQYTSSQSFAPTGPFGENAGAPGTSLGSGLPFRTEVINASSSGGSGSIGDDFFARYYAPWSYGGGGSSGGGNAMGGGGYVGGGGYAGGGFAGGGFTGSRSAGGGEADPGGYAGRYLDPGKMLAAREKAGIGGGYSASQGGSPNLSPYVAGGPGGMEGYTAYGQSMGTYYAGGGNDVSYLQGLKSGQMPSEGWANQYSVWQAYQDYGGVAGDYYAGNFAHTGESGFAGTTIPGGYYGGAFADGGSFVVPGSGGTDSQLVTLHATPGERVSVDAGDGMSGRGGARSVGDINISLHGITDGPSALKSMPQIEAAIMRAVERAVAQR